MKKIVVVCFVFLIVLPNASAERWFSTLKMKLIYDKPKVDIDISAGGHIYIDEPEVLGYQIYCSFSLKYTCDTDLQRIVLYNK